MGLCVYAHVYECTCVCACAGGVHMCVEARGLHGCLLLLSTLFFDTESLIEAKEKLAG